MLLGAIVLCGSLFAYFMYWEAFAPVWCFFAAAGSVVILVHFERTRQVERLAHGQVPSGVMPSLHYILILQLTCLLATANTAPLLAKLVFGNRLAQPLDGSITFLDG